MKDPMLKRASRLPVVLSISGLLGLLGLLGLVTACGGLSTPEAEQRCDQERQANGTNCVTEEAYDECVSCYEECGDSCLRLESCPVQYQCEE